MAEQLKMDLRPKRRPKYRPSDVTLHINKEQDLDNIPFTQPNYLKMITTPHTQDYTSPAIQLNQNAKILAKFIQRVNKSYNQICQSKEETQKQVNKKETSTRDKNSTDETVNGKKQTQSGKNIKIQQKKKSKELYKFKQIHQNTEAIKNLSEQKGIKGVKKLQNISGLIDNKGIYSGPLSNQLSQLQSLYPNLTLANIQDLDQTLNPNLFQFDNPAKLNHKPQQKPKSNPILKQKSLKATVDNSKAKKKQEQKVFRRAAYHVAIAYYIYMKNLSDQGITSGDLIDPTYKARKIKQQNGWKN